MPNPYHDEAGRFASRDEMAAAVDRLEASGDREAWMELRIGLADADAASAKSELAFHKAVTEFASNPDAGFEKVKNDRFFTRTPGWRDYSKVIDSASTPEQLSDAWRVVVQGKAVTAENAAFIMNHADLTPKLEAAVIKSVDWQQYARFASQVKNVDEARAHRLVFEGTTINTLPVRQQLFAKVPEADRIALMEEDSNYVVDYIANFGWKDSLQPYADDFSNRSSSRPNSERYGHYGSVPAMEAHQRYVAMERLLASDTDEDFDSLLEYETGLQEAAERSTIDSTRADKISKQLTLRNFQRIRGDIKDNPKATADVVARFAPKPKSYFLPGAPEESLKAEVLAAKQEWQRTRKYRYSSYADGYADNYAEVQARFDSYPATFAALERKHSKWEKDYMDGNIGEVAYHRMKDRLDNAKRYQKLLGLKAAIHGTEDQLIPVVTSEGAAAA